MPAKSKDEIIKAFEVNQDNKPPEKDNITFMAPPETKKVVEMPFKKEDEKVPDLNKLSMEKYEKIEGKLDGLIDNINKKDAEIDYLKYQLASMQTNQQRSNGGDDDETSEDEWETKWEKDPKGTIETLAEKKAKKLIEDYHKGIDTKKQIEQFDNEIQQKIPALKDKKSSIYQNTLKLMENLKKVDPSVVYVPSLVSLSARAVIGDMILDGTLTPENKDEILRRYYSSENVEGQKFMKSAGKEEITPMRRRIAMGMKVNPEKVY